jgi:hypothetical protein
VEAGLGAKSFAVKTPKKDIRLSTKRMAAFINEIQSMKAMDEEADAPDHKIPKV